MGNCNSSTITINLDRNNLFYFTNETVSGTVEFDVKGTVETDEIYMQLTGDIGYTTDRTIQDTNDNILTQTDYHNVPFYSCKAVFAQPKGEQKEVVYTEGKYSWPFQIPLSHHLPPTINRYQAYPHVKYYLQVVIDKSWYKRNKIETKYITVFPHVNLLQNPQCLQTTVFGNQSKKDIILKGTINKLGYIPGEFINITLEIENPRRVVIKRIDLSMLQSYVIGQSSSAETIFETILPTIINCKNEQLKETFSIAIPCISIPPSYEFQGGIQIPVIVNNRYNLRFSVKVEGMFTNFNVDVPITIGTEPSPDLNQPQMFNSISNSYQSMSIDHDLPPNYNSVMQYKT
jgi:hypothetical protein